MTVEFKSGHNNSRHIDETKLDKTEADYFIQFLQEEIQRHKEAIMKCDYLMRFYHLVPVVRIAYESSILGHRDDISATQKTVDYLKNKWVI
jgi:hypothetical protein